MTTEQIYNYKNSNYENTSYEWNMPLRGNPRKSRTKKIIDLGKDGFFYLSDRSLIFRWFFVFLLLTQIREKKDFILLPGMNCSNVDSLISMYSGWEENLKFYLILMKQQN